METPFFYDAHMMPSGPGLDSTIRVWAEIGNQPQSSSEATGQSTKDDTEDVSKRELILVSTIKEDFSFGIVNQWDSKENGLVSGIAKSLWNSARSNQFLINGLGSILADNPIAKSLGASDMISGFTNTVNSNLNKALLTYNDRVKLFNGTSVNFNIPVNSFIYHRSTFLLDDQGVPYPVTVKDWLNNFLDRTMGGIENLDLLNNYFSLQRPPNGYSPSLKNVNNLNFKDDIKGTYTIEFGNLYKVEGLLMDNIAISLSKNRVKTKDSSSTDILYAEVQVEFSPSVEYLKTHLKTFLKLDHV